jgi:F-type H+-transporting ATPase subunit a
MSVFSNKISRFTTILLLLFLVGLSTVTKASEGTSEVEPFNASEVILHHVMDDHIWHFFDGHYGTLYLPVIVYSSDRGFDVF